MIICITGPMFSGKTSMLIHKTRKLIEEGKKVAFFKHSLDDRYKTEYIVSHNLDKEKCKVVSKLSDMLNNIGDYDVVAIDEVQFFHTGIVLLIKELSRKGKIVIVAGLDLDSDRQPFGEMPLIMSFADEVIKLKSLCCKCKKPAKYTKRISDKKDLILIGAMGIYEPRCEECFED